MTKKLEYKIRAEMRVLRSTMGVTKINKIRNENIREHLKVESIVKNIVRNNLIKVIWKCEQNGREKIFSEVHGIAT